MILRHRFLSLFFIGTFFYNLVFAYAIYTVFFSIRGLDVLAISGLLVWWSVCTSLLEVPSGALSDLWNKKWMLVLASLGKVVCFTIWLISGSNIWLLGLGFFFWSLSSSFMSGTAEAVLYDWLERVKKTERYAEVLGWRKIISMVSYGFALVSGGFIAAYSLDLVFVLSSASLVLAAIFFAFLKHPKRSAHDQGHESLAAVVRAAFSLIRKHPAIGYIFVYSVGVSVILNTREFDQLYMEVVGAPLALFGVFGFLGYVSIAFSYLFVGFIRKHQVLLYLLPFIGGLAIAASGYFVSFFGIALIYIGYFFVSPLSVIADDKIQSHTPSSLRATVASFNALSLQVFSVVLTLAFGLVGKMYGVSAIFLSGGLILVAFGIYASFSKSILGRMKT